MKNILMLVLLVFSFWQSGLAQQKPTGLRGDPAAIADAKAMVETMGGIAIWANLKSVHFVHEWRPVNRMDSYVENEILDLTGPRSWVDRKSEINRQIRAYSPEGKGWAVNDGTFASATPANLQADLARAPFNFYRLIKGVAADDPYFEVRFGEGDIPGTRRLEFYGPTGVLGGWVILNAKKEPIVKATPEYRYTLGPLKRFGNILIPAWGVYDNGFTRYEMISVTGDNKPPDLSLFQPPSGTRNTGASNTPAATTRRITVESEGWQLIGDLRLPAANARVPAVILLNKANGSRTAYEDLAERLAQKGIASLRLDLRAHGDSTNKGKFGPPFDAPMLQLIEGSDADVTAAFNYLKGIAEIDMKRIGFVGASYTGEQMAISARKTSYGKAYAALSPGSFSQGSIDAIDSSGAAWLFVRSADEKHLKGLHEDIRKTSKTAQLFEVAGSKHATELLESNAELAEMIASWFRSKL